MFTGNSANVDIETLRRQTALPDTAIELRAVAKSLGTGEDSIFLRERFTKPVIAATPLDQYRVISFSTHGALAGQLRGTNEPFLMLTPPQRLAPDDDGILKVSDIARMKLNADWVILSACNTAAGDGTPGAEGFSGLSKAFFAAGSRAVLASHWPVSSAATVELITTTFRLMAEYPKAGRATAMAGAMVRMIATPKYAHPFFWAPFVVVGEGGDGL